ncbi:MAG TPA: ACP S-malonyltransferase [bacterium]|nr:ACP S-malonyltransferase [bacterium]
MKTAFIFSGQGTQKVGMGKDLAEKYPLAKSLFERADAALERNLSALCCNGPEEVLSRTENAQPAIFTLEVACLELLREQGITPDAVAGHSVGEYAALYAAGAFDFETGIQILHERGMLMREAAENNAGGMMAVMGLPLEKALAIAKEFPPDLCADIAAYNSPQQLVISGKVEDLQKAGEIAKAKGAKRVIPLKVAGAFHSRLQAEAREKMKAFCQTLTLKPLSLPYVANYSGKLESDPVVIRNMLCEQLTSPVQWLGCLESLKAQGIGTYIECGGAVLTAFVTAFDKEAVVRNVFDAQTLESVQGEA